MVIGVIRVIMVIILIVIRVIMVICDVKAKLTFISFMNLSQSKTNLSDFDQRLAKTRQLFLKKFLFLFP